MPVRLRLKRQGRKGRPFYHIVAADSRAKRDGRFIEKLGTYDPTTRPAQINLNDEAALKWLKNGAQPSDTVRAIFRYKGINLKFALHKQGKSEEEAKRIYDKWFAENEEKIASKVAMIKADEDKISQERLAQEAKVREQKAAAIAAKYKVEEEEIVEEESTAETETPVAEATPEAPAEENVAQEEKTEEEKPAE